MHTDSIVMLCILVPLAAFFTGIGIFAWTRKKPMWFWSGSTVRESEITDVRAYNRANGIMWIVYSLVFWIGTATGLVNMKIGGLVLTAGGVFGSILLMIAYHGILEKYRAKTDRE